MKCNYLIEINGERIPILENVSSEEIRDINDLEKLLRKKPKEELRALIEQLESINSIENLNLDDIKENSVGLYSPADLIDSISGKNSKDRRAWAKLDLKEYANKYIVIAGFGSENVPTQFHKDHIFLNLNYMYDMDNKIVALTELALHGLDSENYETNSKILSTNVESAEAEGLIRRIIDSNSAPEVEYLLNSIKLAYNKIILKLSKDISEENVSVVRDSVLTIWDSYGSLEIDKNYLPKSKTNVSNLKQGDLVLLPIETQDKDYQYKTGSYEIFNDSYIDINGKTILRTISQDKNGIVNTRKTIARIYDTDKERKTTVKESDEVDVRVFNNEVNTGYSYKPGTAYTDVDIKFFMKGKGSGLMYYDSLIDVLKNPEIKVVIDKDSLKVKKLQGNIITLEDGKEIKVTDIKKVNYPISNIPVFGKLDEESLSKPDSAWTKHNVLVLNEEKESIIIRGEHIAFKKGDKDNFLTEGIVIGHGIRNKSSVVLYITASKSGKGEVSYIKKSNIRFVSKPPLDYSLNLEEAAEVNTMYSSLFKDLSGKLNNVSDVVAKNKAGLYRNEKFKYSVQEVNKHSHLPTKEILVHKQTGQIFKIIGSNNNIIKLTFMGMDQNKYLNIPKEDVKNYLLFSKTQLNKSFALSNIRKNRYALFKDRRETSSPVKVWKNPNGFEYALPENLTDNEVKNHALYENGAKDITKEKKSELKNRYKWDSIPDKLYTSTIDGSILKNTESSLYVPITNYAMEQILSDTTGQLQNYLVPGTFITFEGNAKQYSIEKVYKDEVLVSYYHYTNAANDREKEPSLKYVKSEKFFLNKAALTTLKVNGLHLPKWATAAKIKLNEVKGVKDIEPGKSSKVTPLQPSDSVELIMAMVDLIKDKFGVNVTVIHNNELTKFKDPEIQKSAAFVTKEGIYINIDKASIEEPLHELLHLVLATMKHANPEQYYSLVGSVQNHPLFTTIVKNYNDVNTELLEETFVKLLSKTFRKNILKQGVFTEYAFNEAMRQSTVELMDLTKELVWEDPFDLLGMPVGDILFDFGSKIIENEESLINQSSINYMFDISSKIKQLVESGNLKQKCNY